VVKYISKNVISVSKDDSRFQYWRVRYNTLNDDKGVPVALAFTIQDAFIDGKDKVCLTPDRMNIAEFQTCYHVSIFDSILVAMK
jgi:predicted nucleic acid-binding protein